MIYSIHSALSGECLIARIDLDKTNVENLSSETPEGFFVAGSLPELVAAGIPENQPVFAILH